MLKRAFCVQKNFFDSKNSTGFIQNQIQQMRHVLNKQDVSEKMRSQRGSKRKTLADVDETKVQMSLLEVTFNEEMIPEDSKERVSKNRI